MAKGSADYQKAIDAINATAKEAIERVKEQEKEKSLTSRGKAIKKDIELKISNRRLIISTAEIKKIYCDVYFPGYPPDSIAKVQNEIMMDSDRLVANEQLYRTIEWFLLRTAGEQTKEGLTIQLTANDVKIITSILEKRNPHK